MTGAHLASQFRRDLNYVHWFTVDSYYSIPFRAFKPLLQRHRPRGPSIKYVTLFLANFDPPLPVTLCHTSRDPPESTSHISDPPPDFSRPSTKIPDKSPLYKFSLNCLRGFLSGGFVRESFV